MRKGMPSKSGRPLKLRSGRARIGARRCKTFSVPSSEGALTATGPRPRHAAATRHRGCPSRRASKRSRPPCTRAGVCGLLPLAGCGGRRKPPTRPRDALPARRGWSRRRPRSLPAAATGCSRASCQSIPQTRAGTCSPKKGAAGLARETALQFDVRRGARFRCEDAKEVVNAAIRNHFSKYIEINFWFIYSF